MNRSRRVSISSVAVCISATLAPVLAPLQAVAAAQPVDASAAITVFLDDHIIVARRPSDCQAFTVASPTSELVFGFSVEQFLDLDSDGYRDFVIGSPPRSTASHSGLVSVISPQTGATLWEVMAPAELKAGYLVMPIRDQNFDGLSDVVVAGYDSDSVPYTWLLNGASGETLSVVREHALVAIRLVAQGYTLYVPSDIDQSGGVGIDDVISYGTLLPGDPRADVIQDGVVDSSDVIQVVEDAMAGVERIPDNPNLTPAPSVLAAIIQAPELDHPWCHHQRFVESSTLMPAPVAGTALSPQAPILLIIAALEAKGFTLAQIVLYLAGMGFPVYLIAQALGIAVEAVEQILAQSTHWLWCRSLYAYYKSTCDRALSCGGSPDPSKCLYYQENFAANAACAILRSKHATKCVPDAVRHLWDTDSGHAKQIVQRWNAASQCAKQWVDAGCGTWPGMIPRPSSVIAPQSVVATVACSARIVVHVSSREPSCIVGAESHSGLEATSTDWPWIYSELTKP